MNKLNNARIASMSFKKYERLNRVNISTLKELQRSPAHYHYLITNNKDVDTKSKILGRAVHKAVFELEQFMDQYVVWHGGRRAGSEWLEFKSKNEGREILTEDEHAKCLAIRCAVLSKRSSAKYFIDGKAELTALWTDSKTGIKCKGRLDFVNNVLVDLKTTRDASPNGFSREAWNYSYHLQMAFYQDGYLAATGLKLPVVLITVETKPPYVMQTYQMPEHLLDIGREEYSRLLDLLVTCKRKRKWPGYSETELELALPRWINPDFEDEFDLSELGLEQGMEAAP